MKAKFLSLGGVPHERFFELGRGGYVLSGRFAFTRRPFLAGNAQRTVKNGVNIVIMV
ncbi:MAG: hypothetical protein FWE84_01110 [Firmicutes bacterium]|nr:hypothetical protein [Bacillota bacterium]